MVLDQLAKLGDLTSDGALVSDDIEHLGGVVNHGVWMLGRHPSERVYASPGDGDSSYVGSVRR